MSRLVLFLLLALCAPLTAKAADCYFVSGLGVGRYTHNRTDKLEERLLNQDYVAGVSSVETGSHPWHLGVGCTVTTWARAEMSYVQGFQTVVTTAMALCLPVAGEKICSPPTLMMRTASLEGWQLSGVGKRPLSDHWSLTGRLGILVGTARVEVSIPGVLGDVNLSAKKRGVLPVAGVGAEYQVTKSYSIAFEVSTNGPHSRWIGVVGRLKF